MGIDADLLEDVVHHRRVIEERLRRLLQRAGFSLPDEVEMIQSIVWQYHHTRFNTFYSQMTSMFASAPAAVDKDALFLVMADVWNYFPHVSLSGKSPVETIDAGEKLGRWKPSL